MTYGHAGALLVECSRPDCHRPGTISSEAADGALLCARHALDALTAQEAPPMTTNLTTPVRERPRRPARPRLPGLPRHALRARPQPPRRVTGVP